MSKTDKLSIYLSYILRHDPHSIGVDMDKHGYVDVESLITLVNIADNEYSLNKELLEHIVATDAKGRYKFNKDKTKIKACQGHSVPFVEPELDYTAKVPEFLYHGTTEHSLSGIRKSGFISRMNRHAVHLQASESKAKQSAERWSKSHNAKELLLRPVVIMIDTEFASKKHGVRFGRADNGVWCSDNIPTDCIYKILRYR